MATINAKIWWTNPEALASAPPHFVIQHAAATSGLGWVFVEDHDFDMPPLADAKVVVIGNLEARRDLVIAQNDAIVAVFNDQIAAYDALAEPIEPLPMPTEPLE